MFKVAIVGASGLLGRALVRELQTQTGWQVVQTAFSRVGPQQVALDVRDARAVVDFVAREAPDAIVIAAAERRPDVCEHDPAAARALNVDAVRHFAAAATARNAWVLSISTDYVFDGSAPPYLPESTPNPLNAYGRSKLEGERALLDATGNALVLRLPLLYGPIVSWQESAVTSLVPAIRAAAQKDGKPALMDAWATRYPTFTPDVALVIRELLTRCADGDAVRGIAQWSGDEPMTKYEIAQRIARALGIDANLIAQTEPADATPRPRDCHLDSGRLEALGIGRRTPFDAGIRAVLDAFEAQHPRA
ncbi:dTDP-4-dehydrorhamnose reductase [Paraburkholderia bannensis]|uniref:dTDP-4-dehydrorhamnose reductase n=1 Tax=Paraburkholderia bannensis TaxID=765414 RepID=A0A7W9TTQ2_9BURK|nr:MULTISPECIES: SDR family oxidoreductase [Paraburkholderia]MBB3255739.1 dTDP-4-dehydrorhamnose reductase [Paraburkholderia sp. WP4_3_2]MBB6100250.1 dTDP-4-dehydrorhamnose reductase [Paraburkholderia bannensis]